LAFTRAGTLTVRCTPIALLSVVDDTITASGLGAVGPACTPIAVVLAEITLLSILELAVSAHGPGGGVESDGSAVERLDGSVLSADARPEGGVLRPGEREGRGQHEVSDPFGARRIGPRAGVDGDGGGGVTEEAGGIYVPTGGRDGGGTSVERAGGGACSGEIVVQGSGVADLAVVGIGDTVTTVGKGTVGSASVGEESVRRSRIALLSRIDDAITAEGKGASQSETADGEVDGSACVGSCGVEWSFVALLGSVGPTVSTV